MIFRRTSICIVFAAALLFAGCHRADKHVNPIANVDSKQPDKVLFDRAMDAMAHHKYDVARLSLQTLINTYPDSEYIARAKLGIADSWYREGGTAALQQAEIEYKDFITFFPNMPEAAEAQMKVAGIHYRQMEKPDRDFSEAKRAEDEYRTMIQQFPDSKLLPEAKKKLLEVQEALGDREFEIGRFYFMRESWAASTARLQTLVDTYPLYSRADEALMMIGEGSERQIALMKKAKLSEAIRARIIQMLTRKAAESYDRVITRYPAGGQADEARKRLQALDQPVPTPTPEMIAQNKLEQQGREEPGRLQRIKDNFRKGPDFSMAAKNGEPVLVDPKETNATDLIKQMNSEILNAGATRAPAQPAPGADSSANSAAQPTSAAQPSASDSGSSVQIVPGSAPPSGTSVPSNLPNTAPDTANPAPDSQPSPNTASPNPADSSTIPELKPTSSNPPAQGPDVAAPAAAPSTTSGPNAPPTPSPSAPNSTTTAPAQVNDAAPSTTQSSDANGQSSTTTAPASDASQVDKKKESSSKKKKKKKLGIF